MVTNRRNGILLINDRISLLKNSFVELYKEEKHRKLLS